MLPDEMDIIILLFLMIVCSMYIASYIVKLEYNKTNKLDCFMITGRTLTCVY